MTKFEELRNENVAKYQGHADLTVFEIITGIAAAYAPAPLEKAPILMAPSEEQRNVCTKYSSGIVASFITGRGFPDITVNRTIVDGKIKYEITDGYQRVASIFIFITGASKALLTKTKKVDCMSDFDKLECFADWTASDMQLLKEGVVNFYIENDVELANTEMVFDHTEMTDGWTEDVRLWDAYQKRPFNQFDEPEGKGVRDAIFNFTVGCRVGDELSSSQRASYFNDINTGNTPANKTECLKSIAPTANWKIISKFAKDSELEIPARKRMSVEKVVLEMFAIFSAVEDDDKKLTKSWTHTINICVNENELLFQRNFLKFKETYNEFMRLKLDRITCKWMRSKDDELTDSTSSRPKVSNMLALFYIFCENRSCFVNDKEIECAYNSFIREMKTTKGAQYREDMKQGSGNIRKFMKMKATMESILIPDLEKVSKAALTK